MPFIRKTIRQENHGFGADLQELRELRGYSRDGLARLTGIHPMIIAALEDEKLENLTDPAYAERHVRVLVKALEGSATFYVQRYGELLASRGIQNQAGTTMRPRVKRLDFIVSSRLLITSGFLVLILAIGGYVMWEAKQMTSLPALTVDNPTEGLHLDKPSLTVTGQTDAAAKLVVNDEPVIVGHDGRFSVDIDVPPGLSKITIQASRRYSAPVVVERHIFLERPYSLDAVMTSSTASATTSTAAAATASSTTSTTP